MSVQDPVVLPADGTRDSGTKAAIVGNGLRRHLLLASTLCLVIVLAWSSQIINVAQIVAVAIALSVGLNARAVLKLDEIDAQGLSQKPKLVETLVGIAIVAMLVGISVIVASMIFAPLDGVLHFVMFVGMSAGVFAIATGLEAVVSILICFALKPLFSKSAVGAEIAVMLNLQQKYQTKLA